MHLLQRLEQTKWPIGQHQPRAETLSLKRSYLYRKIKPFGIHLGE